MEIPEIDALRELNEQLLNDEKVSKSLNKRTPREERKYKTLTKNFFSGTLYGQVTSVYSTRQTNPNKVADFKEAIKNGDVTIKIEEVTTLMRRKLVELGISLIVD